MRDKPSLQDCGPFTQREARGSRAPAPVQSSMIKLLYQYQHKHSSLDYPCILIAKWA